MSPELINAIQNKDIEIIKDIEKINVFSLGIILL